MQKYSIYYLYPTILHLGFFTSSPDLSSDMHMLMQPDSLVTEQVSPAKALA